MSSGTVERLRENLRDLLHGPESPPSFAGRVLGLFRSRLPSGNSGSTPMDLFAVSPHWSLVATHHEGYVFEIRVDGVDDVVAAVAAGRTKGVLRDLGSMTGIVPASPRIVFGNRDPETMWDRALSFAEGKGFMARLPPFRDRDARIDVGVSVAEMAADHTIRLPGRPSGAEFMPYLEAKLEAYAESPREAGPITFAVPDRKSFAAVLGSGWIWRIEPCSRLVGS